MSTKIHSIKAREILSAGAFPTLETKVFLENGVCGVASVPFGSSAGEHEAAVLTDKDEKRYHGSGMLNAVGIVNNSIANELIGMDVSDQKVIDARLNELDDTPQKTKLGGNSILSVSLACIRAAAHSYKLPLFRQIQSAYELDTDIAALPKPMIVLIEGGAHADNSTDFQEYLITVDMQSKYNDNVRAGIEVYQKLAEVLHEENFNTNVGLEGAYAPSGIRTNLEPFRFLTEAINRSGYIPGDHINLAIDPASSEFFYEGKYNLKIENKLLTVEEMLDYYKKIVDDFAMISIEDPFAEDDWDAWTKFKEKFGNRILVVGDDLIVSQLERLKLAYEKNTVNALIIKPNQAGTLSEIMDTVYFAKQNDIKTIVSHRGGGETIDTFIADLGVAIQSEYIKTGPSRGERVVKYNRLMEIAEELNL